MRVVEEIPPGACLVDCTTRITSPAMARALRDDGVDGVIQYVGRARVQDEGLRAYHVDNILGAGLGFFGVCFADDFAGSRRADDYRSAGALDGLTLASDLESYHLSADACAFSLNACAHAVEDKGFLPCVYDGANHPLAGPRLGALHFKRYWRSLSSSAPAPTYQGHPLGFALVQHLGDPRDPRADWRRVMRGGVNVDVNTAGPDAMGRSLTWMIER